MFDRSRFDWYPTVLHGDVRHSADRVISSDGSLRPKLSAPLDTFVVHHIGAGTGQMNRPTAEVLAGIERWHAIPSRKPNEYNSASDVHGVTWEYAGDRRAAHAHGWNHRAWGHLAVIGLDVPTAAQADGLIRGIRRARTQLVAHGLLTRDHRVVAHSEIGITGCPGALRTGSWWAQIVAPLPSAPPPTAPTEEDDMLVIDWRPGRPEWVAMVWNGAMLSHVWNGHADAVLRRHGASRQTVTDQELTAIIESSRTTTPCPPTLPSAMAARWDARAL